jgi:pSer/pThr/pTyr-binding forkhead associated (FHA) protein
MADSISISLTIDLPGGKTVTQEFTSDEPIMIGSGGSAHVKIEDEEVSSLHCMIKPADGGLVVLDLGSDEGTELNGKEITGETPLTDGDTVSIGSTRIAVHFGGDMLAPTVPIRSMQDLDAGDKLPEATVKQAAPEPDVTAPGGVPEDDSAHDLPDDEDDKPTIEEKTIKADDKKAAKADKAEKQAAKSDDKKAKKDKKEEKKADKAEKKADKEDNKPAAKKPQRDVKTQVVRNAKMAVVAHGHKTAKLQTGDLDVEVPGDQQATKKDNVDVSMIWDGSVLGVTRLSGGGAVTIGHAPGNSFQVSDTAIPDPAYKLVTLDQSGATVHVASGMEAEVDGEKKSGTIKLDLGQKATIRVGAIEFVVQYSQKFTPIAVSFFETVDYLATKIFAIALILQLGMVLAFLITPQIDDDDDEDLLANAQEWTQLLLKEPEKKKEKKQDLSGKKAAKHKDDEGLFGKKDKPKEDKVASKKGAPTVDKDKREEDRKIAMDALAALGLKGPQGAVSNVLGPGGLGSGINNALGGLRGTSMGDAGGAGGLGSRGTGAGGGGNALGIGGLGSGTGRGSGGRGGIDLGGRGKGMTRIKPGKVTYQGSLNREEIERVLRRVKSQIRFCYERELAKDPNLNGKVVIGFVIAGTGLVSTAKAAQNTMGNDKVGSCVVRIIQRLRFPKPRGGGQVIVNYPYLFNPG